MPSLPVRRGVRPLIVLPGQEFHRQHHIAFRQRLCRRVHRRFREGRDPRPLIFFVRQAFHIIAVVDRRPFNAVPQKFRELAAEPLLFLAEAFFLPYI